MAEERVDEVERLSYVRRPTERFRIPAYRKVMSGVMIGAGVVVLVLGCFAEHGAARANIMTAGGGLVIWGVVILFQHVRVW